MLRLGLNLFLIWLYANVLLFLPHTLQAQCHVSFGGNSLPPLLMKTFGNQTLSLRKGINRLTLSENETLRTHCSNGHIFQPNYHYSKSTQIQTLNWRCENQNLFTTEANDNEINDGQLSATEFIIGCQSGSIQQIYVSNIGLPQCNNAMTFVVGYNFGGKSNLKTAAICYDLKQLQLNYVSYIAYPNRNVFNSAEINASNDLQGLGLDSVLLDFSEYFNFVSNNDIDIATLNNEKQNEFFQPQLFEYKNLIQDMPLLQDVSPYDYILNIIWYKNLRLGNWKHFLNALQMHTSTDTNNYQVRLGTSGNVDVPISSSCSLTEPLIFTTPNKLVKVPKYIWAHLHKLKNETTDSTKPNEILLKNNHEDFVIVAMNTPYINLVDSINFCTSICSEIPWLQSSPFATLRLMPLYGVVLCCSVADVAAKLDNFPQQIVAASNITYGSSTLSPYLMNKQLLDLF